MGEKYPMELPRLALFHCVGAFSVVAMNYVGFADILFSLEHILGLSHILLFCVKELFSTEML